MNKLIHFAIIGIVIISVFLVANLFVFNFFEADGDIGGFYSIAITILAVYLYKKHAK